MTVCGPSAFWPQHVLQLYTPSPAFHAAYYRCAQMLAQRPWNVIPTGLLEGLMMCGGGVELRHLRHVILAARARCGAR
eukprot:6362948-Pyramimonas_sp.AAC.1